MKASGATTCQHELSSTMLLAGRIVRSAELAWVCTVQGRSIDFEGPRATRHQRPLLYNVEAF
jgi:hypothetical protein